MQPARSGGGSLGVKMALRGGGWGLLAGVASVVGVGVAAALGTLVNHPDRAGNLGGLGSIILLALLFGGPVGALVGLGLGTAGGGLLGSWTAAHPRPRAERAAYHRQAVPVVGALMGAVIALALVLAQLGPFVALFVAVEAGLAAGWSTCQLLGWYAAQPD